MTLNFVLCLRLLFASTLLLLLLLSNYSSLFSTILCPVVPFHYVAFEILNT